MCTGDYSKKLNVLLNGKKETQTVWVFREAKELYQGDQKRFHRSGICDRPKRQKPFQEIEMKGCKHSRKYLCNEKSKKKRCSEEYKITGKSGWEVGCIVEIEPFNGKESYFSGQ